MTATVNLRRSPSTGAGWFAFAGLFLVGTAMDSVCRYRPAALPFVMPWEFSWTAFLATFVTLGWYWRGLQLLPKNERPSPWRIGSFVIGLAADYAVLQTHFDYLAQHMFFIHRAAHFVLLYPAPMLIALSAAGPVLREGMPDFLAPLAKSSALRGALAFMRRPTIAPALFIGLVYFWLIPQIHTRAMLDANLHDLMDWSVAISGIVFWTAMLDRRTESLRAIPLRTRIALIFLILLPQIALGAILWSSAADAYPIYAICGRLLAMTALDDQHYGGLIIALPSTVMSLIATIVLMTSGRHDQKASACERS
jgi:putative membrane protein